MPEAWSRWNETAGGACRNEVNSEEPVKFNIR